MFEDLMASYKLLDNNDKRQKNIEELKLMIALLENLCRENNIQYRPIKSKEILDINNGNESESDYLEALFVYIEYLKEVLGSILESKF